MAELLLENLPMESSRTAAVSSKSRGKNLGVTSCYSHRAPNRQRWAYRPLELALSLQVSPPRVLTSTFFPGQGAYEVFRDGNVGGVGRVVQSKYRYTVFYATDIFWKFECQCVFCKFNRILQKLEGVVI